MKLPTNASPAAVPSIAARHRSGRALTLIELMIVVVVAAIIAIGALPDRGADLEQQVKIASQQLESDVTYARSLSIAQPADPAAIKFDVANEKYWLARQSDLDTPVSHPRTKKPYVIGLGKSGRPQTKDVSISGMDTGGDGVIAFDNTGNTKESTTSKLQLSAGGASVEMSISPVGAQITVSSQLTEELKGTLETVATGLTGLGL